MKDEKKYNMGIAEFEDRRVAQIFIKPLPIAAAYILIHLRDYGTLVENRKDVDIAPLGADRMESYLMDSQDKFEVLFRGGEIVLIAIDIFLGWTDVTKTVPSKPEGKMPLSMNIWLPKEYFEDFSILLPNEATLEECWNENPKETGDPYRYVEYYTMGNSPDGFEIFYYDKDKEEIGDVRMHAFLKWVDEPGESS